ncbi:secreted RxLR effector protein 78-like [Magnolia sinica]|uniref:secreted RxLR effector protein 78-like n=1 Tax=Magnolia sinica TaxID=86752 RepID=UPI002658482B|nr:secreted RxLR effector protein 78-like [Magnolia sinica]
MALEAMRNIDRKSRGGNLIIKLDQEKAYDKVEWGFLKMVMKRFCFSDRWVLLMEACWGNCWFSVLFNGEPTGFFKSSRGLRQGDPISPGLFILTAEVFSKNFKQLVERGWCRPFKLPRGCLILSHLLFADDTLLFVNGNLDSSRMIKAFLEAFQATSGQHFNF